MFCFVLLRKVTEKKKSELVTPLVVEIMWRDSGNQFNYQAKVKSFRSGNNSKIRIQFKACL